jgi:hypothetical protein
MPNGAPVALTWTSDMLVTRCLGRLLLRTNRQSLTGGKSRIESTFERSSCLYALDHDKIIVLPLEAGRGKVRGAGAQESAA